LSCNLELFSVADDSTMTHPLWFAIKS
jgi:hypothetical protein